MNKLLHSSNLALTNGNQPELVTFVNSVVDFILANENGRVFLNWDRNALMQAVAYNMAKGTFLCKTKDNKLDGLFMWYRCNDGDEHDPWMEDNPKGDSIYLSILFAKSKETLRKLVLSFISVEPDVLVKKLFGFRYYNKQSADRKVQYDLRLFNKLLKIKD